MRYILTGLLSLIFALTTFCQIDLTGVIVNEENDGMPGATIWEMDTKKGAVSDLDGKFVITVNDTSRIQISYVGYYDTIFLATDYSTDTIRMRPMPYDSVGFSTMHYHYYRTKTIGYYGDFNKMPYGLTLYYFRPYLLRKTVLVNTNLTFKTDFDENTDFTFRFGKSDIIRKEKYRLSSTFYFHFRDLMVNQQDYRVNDYKLMLRNYLFNFIHLSGGVMYRDNFTIDNDLGFVLGFDGSIWKTMSHLSGELNLIENDFEYSVALYQRLAKNIRVLRSIQIGFEYNKYLNYDELNFLMRYSLN